MTTHSTQNPGNSVKLTPDELAALDEGIRSAVTERHYTLEEVIQFARERRQAWKQIPQQKAA